MKKSLIAVGMVGLLGLTSVAVAAEFDWSGSIRAGYQSRDTGKTGSDTVAELGKNAGSRINLNASTDSGNGQTAGTELSYSVDGSDISVRRQNIWLSGGWGKLTLGEHGGIYRSAANWDQSAYLGGNVRLEAGSAGGDTAIVYASNLGGPFSFDIEVASTSGIDAIIAVEAKDAILRVEPVAEVTSTSGTVTTPGVDEVLAEDAVEGVEGAPGLEAETIGRWAATAHYNFGAVTANLGYNALTGDDVLNRHTKNGYEKNTAFSINGTAGGFGYYLAYEISKHSGKGDKNLDATTVGLFLSYDAGDNRFYVELEDASVDNSDMDPKASLLGYRYDLGEGIDFTIEHVTVDATEADDSDAKNLNLTLKYGF